MYPRRSRSAISMAGHFRPRAIRHCLIAPLLPGAPPGATRGGSPEPLARANLGISDLFIIAGNSLNRRRSGAATGYSCDHPVQRATSGLYATFAKRRFFVPTVKPTKPTNLSVRPRLSSRLDKLSGTTLAAALCSVGDNQTSRDCEVSAAVGISMAGRDSVVVHRVLSRCKACAASVLRRITYCRIRLGSRASDDFVSHRRMSVRPRGNACVSGVGRAVRDPG